LQRGTKIIKPLITEIAVSSYPICHRKSYQVLFNYPEGYEQSYAALMRQKIKNSEHEFFRSKKHQEFVSFKSLGDADAIRNVNASTGSLIVQNTHLFKGKDKSKLGGKPFEPLIFVPSNKIIPADRVKAHFIGHVLDQVQGGKSTKATIILVDGENRSIRIDQDIHTPIINELQEWIESKSEIPQITFNKHCQICPFEAHCLSVAKKDDSISLLGRMTPKVQQKFESKGIFTVKQLSFLFKCRRRRSRYWGERKPVHQYELQALALRTEKIYTTELIEPPHNDIELFVDFESLPEQKFHYLMGVYVSSSSSHKYYPFWSNTKQDEKQSWLSFLKIIDCYPDAPLFHYGNYENKVIKELGGRYETVVDNVLGRLCNLNSYIFGRIYFPTYTNKLKDICAYLGYSWTDDNASGLNSIVLRSAYDETHGPSFRDDLILYNQEDCINLKKLKHIISTICSHDSVMPNVMDINVSDQLLNSTGSRIVKDFDAILKSAHGRYEQLKITTRKKKKAKSSKSKVNTKKISKSQIDKEVRVARGRICPIHKRALKHTSKIAETILTDLIYTPKGLKKLVIKYWGYKGRCPRCSHRHSPPGLRELGKGAKYGAGLKAWIVYQRLSMRLPFRKISQLLEDTFNLELGYSNVERLVKPVCDAHKQTERAILKMLLNSPKIHADETLINIQGKIQYVWVFTDGENVIFRLTPTRDSSITHEILKGFSGVLVSDFFAGYDAVDCQQQKCWVHLIRDINDDLRKSPFDSELEQFVLALRDILSPIFDAIEIYGLKKRNLNKFRKYVDFFYKNNINEKKYKSDVVKKYQKRLLRYRQSLFVFLERDGIPWNNNMAERALRHLAVQRKISGSFSESGMNSYLVLLGVMQTCRFQNKPFLEFLMSGEKNISKFKGKKNIKGWAMT